jgi:hypothetical protein
MADSSLRISPLKVPFDITGQCDNPLFDLDVDVIGGETEPPIEDVDCPFRNLVIRGFLVGWQSYLDFLCDRLDAFNSPLTKSGLVDSV